MKFNEINTYWFETLSKKDWWSKSSTLDQHIKDKYLAVYFAIVAGEYAHWREHDEGRLAEIIVLDQFSRNMFRGEAKAFAHDSMALALSQEAVRVGAHQRLVNDRRAFLLMPLMHSESSVVHEQALQLFTEAKLEGQIDFELRHKEIIDRFGRYPHRNDVLGRTSTKEELAFLQLPGSSF